MTAGCSESPPEPQVRASGPNVVFVVMDTTRADHLSISGWKRDTTPNLTALAADAVTYSRAHSVAPWTLPSHMSMFTGQLPGQHLANWSSFDSEESKSFKEIMATAFSPPSREQMLPRRLKELGYNTVGISCNPWISARCGFDEGFDALYPAWRRLFVPDESLTPSPLELPLAKEHLTRRGGRAISAFNHHVRANEMAGPFFLFVNLLDAHYPYKSARAKGLEYGGDPAVYRMMSDPRRVKGEMELMVGKAEADFEEFIPFYDGCIHYVDWVIGLLVQWLKDRGVYDETMIVITSDHGEHLGEGGRFSHQLSVEEELLWVPLIVKYPGNRTAGTVDDNPLVSVADVYSTILGVVDPTNPTSCYGKDLSRMEDFDRPYSVAEYYYSNCYLDALHSLHSEFDPDPHRAVTRVIYAAGRKFVYRDMALQSREPFDPSTSEAPSAELEEGLSAWLRQYVSTLTDVAKGDPSQALDPEFVEALRSLGYVK